MKLTFDGVPVDLANANIEVTVNTTMPGAMIALVIQERPPALLLVVTPPPTQNAESLDSNPVAVTWPAHNTAGGVQITGGIGPYSIVYTPARGSNFAVGSTQVIVDVTSSDLQVAQTFFNVDVTEIQDPPYATFDVIGPSTVSAFSNDGNPVSVAFAAQVTGGLQPYLLRYFDGATEKFSGNSFAVGSRTIDIEGSDSETPPNVDNGQSFILSVFNVGSVHAYFNSLVGLGSFWKGMSFRPVAGQPSSSVHYANQLLRPNQGGYAASNSAALAVTYSPGSDTDPRAQDAAKIIIGTSSNSLLNQVRFPLNTSDGNRYLVTWDRWFGAEFAFNVAAIPNYKTFQFDSARQPGGQATIWTEINNHFQGSPATAGLAKVRYYAQPNTPTGPNYTGNTTNAGPQLATFAIALETWTRYWILFDQQDTDPSWTLFSMWIADETRAPVQLFNQLQITEFENIRKWWLEDNTSTDPIAPGRPELVAYIRNLAVMLNEGNVASLLVQP